MSMESIKTNYEETGRAITGEEVEEFICYTLDLLEENLFLIGYNKLSELYEKRTIKELFNKINVETILHAKYINDNEQEIEILLIDGRKVILQIP